MTVVAYTSAEDAVFLLERGWTLDEPTGNWRHPGVNEGQQVSTHDAVKVEIWPTAKVLDAGPFAGSVGEIERDEDLHMLLRMCKDGLVTITDAGALAAEIEAELATRATMDAVELELRIWTCARSRYATGDAVWRIYDSQAKADDWRDQVREDALALGVSPETLWESVKLTGHWGACPVCRADVELKASRYHCVAGCGFRTAQVLPNEEEGS